MAKFGMAVKVCEGLLGKGVLRSVLVRHVKAVKVRRGLARNGLNTVRHGWIECGEVRQGFSGGQYVMS